MFIKLDFKNNLNNETEERIIKISRIQEIRKLHPNDSWTPVEILEGKHKHNHGSEVLITGESGFLEVAQTVDEIFGAVSK